MDRLHYGFLDESPSLGDYDNFFVVGILFTQAPHQTPLRHIPKRIRSGIIKKKLKQVPEIKFNNSNDRTRKKVLQMIADQEVELMIYVVDKQSRRVKDSLVNYALIVGNAVAVCLREMYSRLSLIVDKKYTSPEARVRFNQIVEQVARPDRRKGF